LQTLVFLGYSDETLPSLLVSCFFSYSQYSILLTRVMLWSYTLIDTSTYVKTHRHLFLTLSGDRIGKLRDIHFFLFFLVFNWHYCCHLYKLQGIASLIHLALHYPLATATLVRYLLSLLSSSFSIATKSFFVISYVFVVCLQSVPYGSVSGHHLCLGAPMAIYVPIIFEDSCGYCQFLGNVKGRYGIL